MPLPITLQKLRMYREWIEYSKGQEFEDYDTRWEDFLDEWRTEKALNMLSESFSSEDEFDEASWGESFVEQVYSGDADEMMYLELYANWLNQRNTDYIMRTVEDPDRSPALWNNVYGWWNSMSDEAKEEVIDEDIFVKYYNDALESYGDYEPEPSDEPWLDEYDAEFYGSLMSCPVCGGDSIVEGDWADCNYCQVKWNVINEGSFYYLEAEDAEDYGVEDVWMAEYQDMICCFEPMEFYEDGNYFYCPVCEESIKTTEFDAESFKEWADEELKDHGDISFDEWAEEEYDEPAHSHHLLLSFQEWADEEMNEEHHNAESFMMEGDCSPENWDYAAHNWEMTQLPMVRGHIHEVGWANSMGIRSFHQVCRDCGLCTECNGVHDMDYSQLDAEEFRSDNQTSYPFWSVIKVNNHGIDEEWGVEDHDTVEDAREACDYYNKNMEGSYEVWKMRVRAEEEVFCSECGYDSKKAKSFSAETSDGNQVFNSCWKCGSGQHLYQISRYPASPDEIAGIGMDPSQATPNWEERRNPPTA